MWRFNSYKLIKTIQLTGRSKLQSLTNWNNKFWRELLTTFLNYYLTQGAGLGRTIFNQLNGTSHRVTAIITTIWDLVISWPKIGSFTIAYWYNKAEEIHLMSSTLLIILIRWLFRLLILIFWKMFRYNCLKLCYQKKNYLILCANFFIHLPENALKNTFLDSKFL